MRIAIIGSGVSGLVSAYLLAPHHTVTVFEKDNRIGGHAHTITVREGDKSIPVDNGFMVYNPGRYPHFVQLLKALGVDSVETTMSFGVAIPNEISFRGDFPFGLFADKKNLINIRYLTFLFEVLRFNKIAKRVLQKEPHLNKTLGEFIKENKFSADISHWYLYPMLSAIWSIKESQKVSSFPALSTFTFLNNHKLLDSAQPRWRTIPNGSIQYVSKIQKSIESHGAEIQLNSHITSVKRSAKTVTIQSSGEEYVFDYVLFATHADVTRKLISDISKAERLALAKFTYTENTTVLHKDTRLVPKNKMLLAAWNYTVKSRAVFTYCMNILQHISQSTPIFVTLNPHMRISKNRTYAVENYSHPQYNMASLEGQRLITDLQGVNRTLYAGAHLGYGFHEDGVVSAINAVKHLNIMPPWENQ